MLIYSIAGVGKTVIASATVEHLHMKNKKDTLVLCIFCDYNSAVAQTLSNIISGLLKQVIQACKYLTTSIESFYDQRHSNRTYPSSGDLIALLTEELKLYDHVYIILDALDELESNGCQEELVNVLRALGNQIYLLVTSRNLYAIELLLKADMTLEIWANDADVKKCIMTGLKQGHLPTHLDKDKQKGGNLHEKIFKTVVEKADGMYVFNNTASLLSANKVYIGSF